mgnify:CR=1 FL=1
MSELQKHMQSGPSFVPTEQAPYSTTSIDRASGVLTNIGHGSITQRADAIRHSTDEEMIWQEKPSLALLIGPALRLLITFVILLAASIYASERLHALAADASIRASAPTTGQRNQSNGSKARERRAETLESKSLSKDMELIFQLIAWSPYVVAIALLAKLIVTTLRIKMTKYTATSQRLVVESGVLRTISQPFELHRLGDAIIEKPLLLRPFGVSNLLISRPGIYLQGIRNAAFVRDILRTSGQIEARDTTKIAWRNAFGG